MEKGEVVKMVREKGCSAIQNCPLDFFDDGEFVDNIVLANEDYIVKRQRAEEGKFNKIIEGAERAHFDDILTIKMADREKSWQKKVKEDINEIKKVPFDLISKESFLKAIKLDNEENIMWGEKHGYFVDFADAEGAKKKMRNNFALAINERQKERKDFWIEKIGQNKENIMFLPFDLVFDSDFRLLVYADSVNYEKEKALEEKQEVLGKLFNERLKDAKLSYENSHNEMLNNRKK